MCGPYLIIGPDLDGEVQVDELLLKAAHLVAHHGQLLPRAHLPQLTRILSLPRGRVPLVRQGVRRLLPLEGWLVDLDALGEGGACGVLLLLFGRHVFKFGSFNYKRAFKFK